jgi:hypothetical protein
MSQLSELLPDGRYDDQACQLSGPRMSQIDPAVFFDDTIARTLMCRHLCEQGEFACGINSRNC